MLISIMYGTCYESVDHSLMACLCSLYVDIMSSTRLLQLEATYIFIHLQDILNHVIEDLDEFIKLLKTKTAAWNELEKKKKKSRRKKHDGVCAYIDQIL